MVFKPANSEAFFDLIAAICEESILLIWPAPIPTVELFFAYIIAFDFTCLAILKAKIKSVISLEVGFLIVTIFKLFSSKISLSLSCIRKPSDRSFMIWSEFIIFF